MKYYKKINIYWWILKKDLQKRKTSLTIIANNDNLALEVTLT